jgi:hypothetical protein
VTIISLDSKAHRVDRPHHQRQQPDAQRAKKTANQRMLFSSFESFDLRFVISW